MNWKKALLIVALLMMFIACQPAGVEPAATDTAAIPPAPTLISTTALPIVVHNAPAVASEISPYAGLWYTGPAGLWQIQADGTPALMGQSNLLISPSGSFGVYTSYEGDLKELHLVDLTTQQDTIIPNGEYAALHAVAWLNDQQLLLQGMAGVTDWYGMPLLYNLTTAEITPLTTDIMISQAIQPTTPNLIAIELNGSLPILYDPNTNNLTSFNPAEYSGWSYEGDTYLSSPTWSPDGLKLAWMVSSGSWADNSINIATAIFDLSAQTVTLVNSYTPLFVGEGGIPSAHWSPDGQWLAMQRPERRKGVMLVKADGSESHHLGDETFLQFVAWNPAGGGFVAFRQNPATQTFDNLYITLGSWEETLIDLSGGLAKDWTSLK